MNDNFNLILASNSPQRKKLLKDDGFNFTVYPSQLEEKVDSKWDPVTCVKELAKQKAKAIIEKIWQSNNIEYLQKNSVILAADTVAAINKEIFGKPNDYDDAYKMLWKLSRNRHMVITGVCLWPLIRKEPIIDVDITYITMRHMKKEEIKNYINSKESYGKAGAYAIQSKADKFVEKIEGNFDNVVGLPLKLVHQLLEQWEKARI
mgnify:CR=1 FL=1